MRSIKEILLTPKPGKKYWRGCHREWREEFIYFLLVDRFHDSINRHPLDFADRHPGFGVNHQLQQSCGGTVRGIINHIEYIRNLGCTSIWLSPLFGNNPESYHGYAIDNYLDIDSRWGSKEDLEELVEIAHDLDMRVFLDIVLRYSGNNWNYPGGNEYYYYEGLQYPLENWRFPDKPIPDELRNPDLYNRKGQIRNFEAQPEARDGDFFSMKAFRNDDSRESLYVQDLLISLHCYWIRETDIDGFRVDAVKHMREEAISRFCSHVREYAYSLGKRNFFLFGELLGAEETYNRYIGPKTPVTVEDKNLYYGLNSVLDFPLYHILEGVIKGIASPEKLIDRYTALQKNALSRGENGEYLVTFIDNHDQVGRNLKARFGHDATPQQIVAGIGFLLCALGTPCIYYGTEQGMEGAGNGDWFIRECLFDPEEKNSNLLNCKSSIYQAISTIAKIRNTSPVLKFGRMYIRKLSVDGHSFHLPECPKCTLAFSRILFNEEILVVYNSSNCDAKVEHVEIDCRINSESKSMKSLFGYESDVEVLGQGKNGGEIRYVGLYLKPMQFVILKSS
ncbi:alpha-amylase family glycosyl hydrolase [Asinibacterium sp. OR53]|uniref:alpha-amylase family glycosyl hydrolase n=1 Tax=Asinibacterium sp. OR53 TaxID=925409 RepID=UPI00047EC820|nr:alpha-amylase family glycosyl hydrolase [Asinibacterium sp. OR53]